MAIDKRGIQSEVVYCQGGLDLTQDVLIKSPGSAVQLQNFEPALNGGYRRITGYTKYSSTAVPGQGPVLGIYVYSGGVIAVRADAVDSSKSNVYYGSGTSWTKINTDTRSVVSSVSFSKYNWNGVETVVIADGVNRAAKFDGTTWTVLNGANAPTNPSIVAEFKNYLFLSGYTSGAGEGAIICSAPLNDTNYSAALGAKEIVIGDFVVGLASFRDNLIIFCRKSIHYLSIDLNGNFLVQPISRNIGCLSRASIRELNGDLIYLSLDGIRTLAGTQRFNDVELGTISTSILPLVSNIDPGAYSISSVAVRAKNQYRLWYTASSDTGTSASGVLGGVTRMRGGDSSNISGDNSNPSVVWQWSQLKGIKAYCADSAYLTNARELVVHGGYDGYAYQQEVGNSFNGAPVSAVYRTPDFILDDAAIRKTLHRITLYAKAEGNAEASFNIYYDHNDPFAQQPATYNLTGIGGVTYTFDDPAVKFDDAVITFDLAGNPILRQNVAGSGRSFAFQFASNDTKSPYTLQGFLIEYALAGRR